MPSVQEPKAKGKMLRRSVTARPSDAIRVSTKDGESYAEILKAMKAKVNPQNSAKKMSPMLRGAVPAQYSGRSSRG